MAKKGARVAWVLDGQYLIVTGFSKYVTMSLSTYSAHEIYFYFHRQAERLVMVFRTSDLEQVHVQVLDVSPAILIPHYDEDSSTLFLTSKVI